MPQRSPEVSVVVPTRNRAERLEAALRSLAAQTLSADRFEVIVVDHESSDRTPELLRAQAARTPFDLQVVRHAAGGGPGAVRNVGWRRARAPLVAFMDDDCVAAPAWLEAGLAAWGRDPARFVQGATTPIEDELHRMGPCSYSIDIRGLVPELPACNIFYPRALLERLDGFDAESFPVNGEDTDLGWRAKANGAEAVFAPEAHVQHAVVWLGPRGFLRRNSSWGHAMLVFRRHPELRRERLWFRLFWNVEHYELAKLVLAVVLPGGRSLWPLRLWLAKGYFGRRYIRPRRTLRSLRLLGWFLIVDSVETVAVLRGGLRHGTVVL